MEDAFETGGASLASVLSSVEEELEVVEGESGVEVHLAGLAVGRGEDLALVVEIEGVAVVAEQAFVVYCVVGVAVGDGGDAFVAMEALCVVFVGGVGAAEFALVESRPDCLAVIDECAGVYVECVRGTGRSVAGLAGAAENSEF